MTTEINRILEVETTNKEIRRYIEDLGFSWIENLSMIHNVAGALEWMVSKTVDLNRKIIVLDNEIKRLNSEIQREKDHIISSWGVSSDGNQQAE